MGQHITLLSGSQPNHCEIMRHWKIINLKSTFPSQMLTLWCRYLWNLIIAMGRKTFAGARVAALWIEQTDPKPISNCAVHPFKVWHLWWRNGEFGYKWSSLGKVSRRLTQSLSLSLCNALFEPGGTGCGPMGPQMSNIWAAYTLTWLNVYIQWHTHILNNKTTATKYREGAGG